jgi:hypothetical protein
MAGASKGGFEQREIALWAGAEWAVTNPSYAGNPFDLVARASFRHAGSGRTRTTEMFYDGDDTWRFRFAATRPGEWTFTTQCDGQDGTGDDRELHGLSGKLLVEPDPRSHGFITNFGDKWGWSGSREVFIPQYVMGKDLEAYYDRQTGTVDEGRIDADIREFIVEHGFTGFHLQGRGRWFNLAGKPGENPNPDPRTYAVVETVIRKVHAAGGACHLWMWGKDKNRGGDGPRALVGGPMTDADRRNLRYMAARLGPIPGWSIGYGYDTENLWASPDEMTNWKRFLESHSGWDHFIGARVGFDEKGLYGQFGKGIPKPALNDKYNAPIGDEYTAWLDGDYIGYTSYRPLYDRYVAVLEHQPEKPSFEEDRFRLREARQWTHKDYSPELTVKGLWHSAMAGGVANIWGNLLPDDDRGGSQSYDHGDVHIKDRIRTYATFFRDRKRFRRDFIRDNALADPREGTTEVPEPPPISVCLRNPGNTHFVFYKEAAATVGMDLSRMSGPQPAVAVDTRKAYKEIDLGTLRPREHTWEAPYRSDWALAVGESKGSGTLAAAAHQSPARVRLAPVRPLACQIAKRCLTPLIFADNETGAN